MTDTQGLYQIKGLPATSISDLRIQLAKLHGYYHALNGNGVLFPSQETERADTERFLRHLASNDTAGWRDAVHEALSELDEPVLNIRLAKYIGLLDSSQENLKALANACLEIEEVFEWLAEAHKVAMASWTTVMTAPAIATTRSNTPPVTA